MLAYIVRRLLLIIPTLFGILLINFIIIQPASASSFSAWRRVSRGIPRPSVFGSWNGSVNSPDG